MAARTYEFHEQSGSDGYVHLAVPVGTPDQRFRVVLTLEPEDPSAATTENGWPPGFFESTAGKWVGGFDIEPEGPPEERDPM